MSTIQALIGLQWGDEGKGKLIDILAANFDVIVRFQGGHNAGHTLVVDQKKYVLHLVPSGILNADIHCVIDHGVVLSLPAIVKEIEQLKSVGIMLDQRLHISLGCPLILPTHVELDHAYESQLGAQKIGTTKSGIGPAYQDQVSRFALRLGDLFLPEKQLLDQFKKQIEPHLCLLKNHYKRSVKPWQTYYEQVFIYRDHVVQYAKDTFNFLQEQKILGKRILFEGAQGSMLDVNLGTYPFVTSSNTVTSSIGSGSAISPRLIDQVIGVTKAYATRVGEGPMVTEQQNETGEKLGKMGHEFGATTGRKRRCGWLDLVALKYAALVNAIDVLYVMKLDVLDAFKTISVCTHYSFKGKQVSYYPLYEILDHMKPVYKEFEGWETKTSDIQSFDQLPDQAKKYLKFISQYIQKPIQLVSVGPERNQTILVDENF